ncbi:hypothetical protein GCM10027051_32200 [Niabella terrae]
MARSVKIELLNQSINLCWSLFAFTPVLWCWISKGVNTCFYLLLGGSFFIFLLPSGIFQKWQFSHRPAFYKNLGVLWFRKFVQDGDWVQRIKDPKSHARIAGRKQLDSYLQTISMYERFHWSCFLFFCGSAVYAITSGDGLLGLWITLANLIYNITTLLLQQYNRIRILRMRRGMRQ